MKIKNILLTGCLVLAAFCGKAQGVSPRDEFKVSASKTKITLFKPGKDSVELTVVRAKHFKSVGRFSLASPLPKGVTMKIDPVPDKQDYFIMHLQADDSAEPTEFYVVPSYSTSGSTRKGVLIKVVVTNNLKSESK